mmetsp:Transcript_43467/g.72238  ORF Transcript_43467/g.72238 Transcript_43467/m.72238 type:complete len:1135 (-) Transcript_43467:375-3779(-)
MLATNSSPKRRHKKKEVPFSFCYRRFEWIVVVCVLLCVAFCSTEEDESPRCKNRRRRLFRTSHYLQQPLQSDLTYARRRGADYTYDDALRHHHHQQQIPLDALRVDMKEALRIWSLDLYVLTGKASRVRRIMQRQREENKSWRLEDSLIGNPEVFRVATAVAEGNLPLLLSLRFPRHLLKDVVTMDEIGKRYSDIVSSPKSVRDYLRARAMAIWTAGGLILGFRRCNHLSPDPKFSQELQRLTRLCDSEVIEKVYVGGGQPPNKQKYSSIWMLSAALEILEAVQTNDQTVFKGSIKGFFPKARRRAPYRGRKGLHLILPGEDADNIDNDDDEGDDDDDKGSDGKGCYHLHQEEYTTSPHPPPLPTVNSVNNASTTTGTTDGNLSFREEHTKLEIALTNILSEEIWKSRALFEVQEMLGDPLSNLHDSICQNLRFAFDRVKVLQQVLNEKTKNNNKNNKKNITRKGIIAPSNSCDHHYDDDDNNSSSNDDNNNPSSSSSSSSSYFSPPHQGGGDGRCGGLKGLLEELELRICLEDMRRAIFYGESHHHPAAYNKRVKWCERKTGINVSLTGILGNRTKYQMEESSLPVALVHTTTTTTTTTASDKDIGMIELLPEVREAEEHLLDQPSYRGYDPKTAPKLNRLQTTTLLIKEEFLHEDIPVDNEGPPIFRMAILRKVLQSGNDWFLHAYALYRKASMEFDFEKYQAQVGGQLMLLCDTTKKNEYSRMVCRNLNMQFARSAFLVPLPLKWHLSRKYAESQIQNMNVNESVSIYSSLGLQEEAIACLLFLKDYVKAESLIRTQLQNNPTPMLYSMLGDATGNVSYYEHAFRISNGTYARPVFELGDRFAKQNNYTMALRCYRTALRIDKSNPSRWFDYGKICQAAGNNASAITAYRRCIAMEPEHLKAYTNLGVLQALIGNEREAVQTLKESLKYLETNPRMWENLILVSFKKRLYKDTIQGLLGAAINCGENFILNLAIPQRIVNEMKNNTRDGNGQLCQQYYRSLGHLFKEVAHLQENSTIFWNIYIEYLEANYRGPPDTQLLELALEKRYVSLLRGADYTQNMTDFSETLHSLAKLSECYINSGVYEKQLRTLELVKDFEESTIDKFGNTEIYEGVMMLQDRLRKLHLVTSDSE